MASFTHFNTLTFMNQLTIESTATTPELTINPSAAVLSVKGKFIDDHPNDFMLKLSDGFSVLVNQSVTSITLVFQFDYINTGGLKVLLMFLKKVEQLNTNGTAIQLLWKTNASDELMIEIGEDLKSVIDVPFEMSIVK